MILRVLSVLMWKHAVVRKRRFIHTAVDCLFPLIFFLLFFALKNKLRQAANEVDEEEDLAAKTEIIRLDGEFIPPPNWIMYYPETKLTNLLMDDVGRKLNLTRLNSTSSYLESGYYFSLSDLSLLPKFTAKMEITEAIIIFQDMTGDRLPNHLNYTIRMNVDFKTGTYKTLDETPEPHRIFGFKYTTFMRIQWAVDTSYITLVTEHKVPQALSLQEFPYQYQRLDELTAGFCALFVLVCWLSLALTFVFLMVRLLEERASGIQELMNMLGVSPKLLGLSHFLNVLPIGLIFSIVSTTLLTVTSTPLIPHSSWFLIFLMLLLYFNTIISFAFACSYIPPGMEHATGLAILMNCMLWIPMRLVTNYKLPYIVTVATGFFPHMPMNWFWSEVGALEVHEIGLSFSNMTETHAENNCSALLSYIFMLIQAAIGYILAWYLSYVRPGRYGQALPWNFLCKASYWSKTKMRPNAEADEEDPITVEQQFFEPAPVDAEPGIKVVNVSKMYPKNRALSNVSLEVYKGEITVLLGHNGAGKTTLMSIITGMTSATEGKVFVNGKDSVKQQNEVRKHLGLCPQHNLFFENLTVRQHIIFYTLLKTGTFAEAQISTNKLAGRLNISDKLNSLPNQLSGGMKRRVQLACALTGGADVLVLDEPTSGLDVETRRELWDLLQSLRGERTVLLTTHFMEEADALGDRVAALRAGVLRCFATPMYLKSAMGSGYRLTLTTIGSPNVPEITKVVTSKVPDAAVKEQTINSISYSLPATHSGKLPGLFTALEAEKSKLGIDSIGVGVSTLEEVFLKLCSDIDTTLTEDEVDNVREPEVPPKKLTGFLLCMRQLFVLLKRHVKYIIYKKSMFLITEIILPITFIALVTYTFNNDKEDITESRAMNLDLYRDRADKRAMYHTNKSIVRMSDVDTVRKQYPNVAFQYAGDIATAMLRTSQNDIFEYNKYLVGVEINETDAKILYTTVVRHAAPVALNLLSNLLAAQHMPWADGRTITTMNDPISRELQLSKPTSNTSPKGASFILTWGILITFVIQATQVNNVSLPCKERQTDSRHIHVMSGCPPELHWLVTVSFHAAQAALTLVLPTVLMVLLLEEDQTTNQTDMLATLALILILGCMSFSVFSYLISFSFGESSTGMLLYTYLFIFAIFTPLTKLARETTNQNTGLVNHLLKVCNYIAPPYALTDAVIKCVRVARLNAHCKFYRSSCPGITGEPGFDAEKCCAGENPRCYLCFDDFSPAKNIIILLVQFLVLLAMVLLTERGFFDGVLDKVMNMGYRPNEPVEQDKMVRAETEYVSKTITLPTKQIPDAMLVHDLHKNYRPFCKKSVNAVRGISFSVKKGECFGLLGVNGAGKSSTFKMLTAEEPATRGSIFGNGYHLKKGNSRYLQTLGYCPQFFGLDMFLTGQENLELILTLRGFDKQRVKEEVRNWLHIVGLEKYAQCRVDGYSGGCMRRLGAASALCGGAELVLLDEPTAGVDVAARRRLWTALRKALRQKRAIIITSHSMDEMEALSSRIAILTAGRVRALGTASGLRAAHAQGYSVVFKLAGKHHAGADEVKAANIEMNQLKGKIQRVFDCTLKDKHKTMLHYHINETMPYSDVFTTLESLRTEFPSLIEDYSVAETTLEEVFLSFAKEQQTEAPHV